MELLFSMIVILIRDLEEENLKEEYLREVYLMVHLEFIIILLQMGLKLVS